MKTLLLLSIMGLMAATSVGCDYTQKFCNRAVDCSGEDGLTVDECVTAFDNNSRQAEASGCGDEYEDIIKCAARSSECTTKDTGYGDGSTYESYSPGSACDAEDEIYTDCINDTLATPLPSPDIVD